MSDDNSFTPFFVWYESQPESMARKVIEKCPSRAAKEFHNDPPYGVKLSETIMVRNIEGRPFTYTQEQLNESR